MFVSVNSLHFYPFSHRSADIALRLFERHRDLGSCNRRERERIYSRALSFARVTPRTWSATKTFRRSNRCGSFQLKGTSNSVAKRTVSSLKVYKQNLHGPNPTISSFRSRPVSSSSVIQLQARRLYVTGPKVSTSKKTSRRIMSGFPRKLLPGITSLVIGGGLFYILDVNGFIQPLPATRLRSDIINERRKQRVIQDKIDAVAAENAESLSKLPFPNGTLNKDVDEAPSAWDSFSGKLEVFSSITDFKWDSFSDSIASYIIPEWATVIPGYIQKLQRELSMAPGSLADEIWQEAHDPFINPEIERSASVRVSNDLCDEEQAFLGFRKQVTAIALAKYLGVPEEEVHPEDVPTIAMVGSGGGLRALVAGTGSMMAAHEAGLFDCVTYTAGVSGSCWLQVLFNSSLSEQRFDKLVDHLKARLGIHIAYPPVALSAVNSAPTNKFLLSGFVEKLKGDPNSDFGLVDVYGLLLSARLLVPKGELEVDSRDLKLSNQREHIKHGEFPMPIYTAVRHEIPIIEEASETEKEIGTVSEETKEKAKKEAWFQWFEFTPYELFCEEFSAGIPMWAVGRKFEDGHDVPMDKESGLHVPELRLSLLLGVFGSAFCATLSHYYKEVKPLVKGLMGFGSIDDMIEGRNEDLSKVHPIDPASIPNFVYGMEGKLPETTPEEVYKNKHIQLMDAGMSNNLPIYPLLRPGRNLDILISFDASADIKQENWLSVADGFCVQRGIKGWPVGAGWPKESDSIEKTTAQLDDAQATTAVEAESKVEDAKHDQEVHLEKIEELSQDKDTSSEQTDLGNAPPKNQNEDTGDLGFCTVWVGTTEERSYTDTEPPPKTKAAEDWQLMEPDAGIAVVYFPLLANEKVEGVDPVTSDYMSTWNFVYAEEQVDKVVELAKQNFREGEERVKRVVRAVWERKRSERMKRIEEERGEAWKRGRDGDHFS